MQLDAIAKEAFRWVLEETGNDAEAPENVEASAPTASTSATQATAAEAPPVVAGVTPVATTKEVALSSTTDKINNLSNSKHHQWLKQKLW